LDCLVKFIAVNVRRTICSHVSIQADLFHTQFVCRYNIISFLNSFVSSLLMIWSFDQIIVYV
jgi:hypothetical protein